MFETSGELTTIDRILAEPECWSIASAWEHLVDGEPRVGVVAFDWSQRSRAGAVRIAVIGAG